MPTIDPITAACHADPYPYYAELRAGPALLFDAHIGMWVASRREAIQAVLTNPHCRVRPQAEPVPRHIAGSAVGAVFAHLVRMNDGPRHAPLKRALQGVLANVDPCEIAAITGAVAAQLDTTDRGLTDWTFALPTCVLARLLGFEQVQLPQVAGWVADFVRCLPATATGEQIAAGEHAVRALLPRLESLSSGIQGLAAIHDHDTVAANLLGLLSQTHEATAGLIGNTIVALLAGAEEDGIAALVEQVSLSNPSVQNTRRFVWEPTTVAGIGLQRGDTVLLLLGSAAQESFGHGAHACPGQAIALTIATAAVQYWLANGPRALGWRYRASPNGRLPEFFNKELP